MKICVHRTWWTIALSLILVACAGGEDPAEDGSSSNNGFRPEQNNPRPPGSDAGNNGATDMNSGEADQGGDDDDTGGGDDDMGGNDDEDMGGGGDDTGDGCPTGACTLGETRCQGEQIQDCIADTANPGCGTWGTAMDCADSDQICSGGQCQTVTSCVDNDGDSYGPMCSAGADCDDSDPNINPGATETCDGIDNDCDSEIDEGHNVGMSCTVGSGSCESQGTTKCDSSGTIYCDAPAPQGEPELCDGLDNDCDQMVDEDGACDFCASDPFEPNEMLSSAPSLTVNQRETAFTCPNDTDFLSLPTTSGSYRIYIMFPKALSDLGLILYENGSPVFTADDPDTNMEGVQFQHQAGNTYAVEVVNNDQVGTFYHVSFVDTWACEYEDGFTPNASRSEAAFFPKGWKTLAWVCDGMSDWYELGDVDAGKTIGISIVDQDQWGDADLFLWGDPDGDGNFDVMEQSAGFGSDETLQYTVSTTGPFFMEVRDFDGIGDGYEMVWNTN